MLGNLLGQRAKKSTRASVSAAQRPQERKPRSAVPAGMLTLLMLAFGGSLALKAFEERQFTDNALLTQQMREAETLAGHVR